MHEGKDQHTYIKYCKCTILLFKTYMKCSYGRRPSSKGSHVSVISVDPIEVF